MRPDRPRFEAQGGAGGVAQAGLGELGAVVELDRRRRGEHRQRHGAARRGDPGDRPRLGQRLAPEHEGMVEGLRADPRRPAQVEARAGDRGDRAGRDQGLVDRQVGLGRDLDHVVVDRRGRKALRRQQQVEVAVVRQVDDRRLVGPRRQGGAQGAGAGDGIGTGDVEGARIALLAVSRLVGQRQAARPHLREGPVAARESARAAMQVGAAGLVAGEIVGDAVEGEAPARDAVGEASDGRAELRGLLDVVVRIVAAEHHRMPVDVEPAEHRPEAQDRHREPVALQPRFEDRAAIRHRADGEGIVVAHG